MKLEILTTAELVPAIRREVARMAAAGEIKIEMEFSIADDADFVALKKQVAALAKKSPAKISETKTETPQRYSAL